MNACMSTKRLSHIEMTNICKSLNILEKPYQPYSENSNWKRLAENNEYAYESNIKTVDSRIIDKKTNQEVWSYYEDFYTG